MHKGISCSHFKVTELYKMTKIKNINCIHHNCLIDGKSNRGNLNSAVAAVKASSIKVYAVGISDINRNELQFIASDPDDEHVFILQNYLDAKSFASFLGTTTCDGKCLNAYCFLVLTT